MADIKVTCPKCGGATIHEKNVAYADVEVTSWDLIDGIPTPDSYDDDDFRGADWEVADVKYQYTCRRLFKDDGKWKRCDWEGNLDDLKFDEAPQR